MTDKRRAQWKRATIVLGASLGILLMELAVVLYGMTVRILEAVAWTTVTLVFLVYVGLMIAAYIKDGGSK